MSRRWTEGGRRREAGRDGERERNSDGQKETGVKVGGIEGETQVKKTRKRRQEDNARNIKLREKKTGKWDRKKKMPRRE